MSDNTAPSLLSEDFQAVGQGMNLLRGLIHHETKQEMDLLAIFLMDLENEIHRKVAAAIFFTQKFRRIETREDADEAMSLCNIMRERLRNEIRQVFSEIARQERYRETDRLQKAFDKLVTDQKAGHQPHTQGTVAELAKKLGVSKSEIRRMKVDGSLDEALSKLAK